MTERQPIPVGQNIKQPTVDALSIGTAHNRVIVARENNPADERSAMKGLLDQLAKNGGVDIYVRLQNKS